MRGLRGGRRVVWFVGDGRGVVRGLLAGLADRVVGEVMEGVEVEFHELIGDIRWKWPF
jgi:hypothetical protein